MYVNAQASITLGALVYLYVRPQQELLLRAQHVRGRVRDRAGRLRRSSRPRRRASSRSGASSTPWPSSRACERDSATVNALFNPYAAVPSMHVAFALMIGVPIARLAKHRVTRWVWALYPLLVIFVIVATANHFFADAVLGALTAGARRLGRRVHGTRPAGRLDLPAAGQGDGLMAGPQTPPRPRAAPAPHARPARRRRELMRNRLIESRLTPNAISVTGLDPQRRRRRADLAGDVHPRRHRVHRRLGLRHARRPLLAHVRQGHASSAPSSTRRSTASRRASSSPRSPPSFAADDNEVAAAATVVAVLASLMVSYTRARAEALGVECKVGIASRAVRVVILSVGHPVRRRRPARPVRVRAGGPGHDHRPAAHLPRPQRAAGERQRCLTTPSRTYPRPTPARQPRGPPDGHHWRL